MDLFSLKVSVDIETHRRQAAGVAKLLLKAEFKFTRRNGVALLMYEPTTSVLDGGDGATSRPGLDFPFLTASSHIGRSRFPHCIMFSCNCFFAYHSHSLHAFKSPTTLWSRWGGCNGCIM